MTVETVDPATGWLPLGCLQCRGHPAVAGVAQDKLAEALRQSISQIAKG